MISIKNIKLLSFYSYTIIFILILNNSKINCAVAPPKPCDLKDSIVLTDRHKLLNGSYIYDGIHIPEDLIHEDNSKVYGCICLIKECIPWCCSHKYQRLKNGICQNETNAANDANRILEDIILLKSDYENNTKNVFKHFHVQMNKNLPCRKTYALNHIENDYDEWHIYPNGTIFQPAYVDYDEEAYTHKGNYCFALDTYLDENSTKYMVSPYFCQAEPDNSRHNAYGIIAPPKPCDLKDSIVLTDRHKLLNGSYIYDGIHIPEDLIHEDNSKVYSCICLIKECIPWCCSHKYQRLKNGICQNETNAANDANRILEDIILLKSDYENSTKNVFKHFHVQMNKNLPCRKTYALNHIENDYDEWHIFPNGTIFQPAYVDYDEEAYTHKGDYCFDLDTYLDENATKYMVSPYFCQAEPDNSRHNAYGITLLLSQPFMIITIIIYLAIPKLRNLHGKSLVCYLSSLSISYFCLAYILLQTDHEEHLTVCTLIGYICYVTIMSAYLWLSAISFDLWFNFSSYDKARASKNIRFMVYCFICYGIAIIYAIAAYVVQNSTASEAVKPGIGYKYCYLNVEEGYSAVIWLYQPLICVITFNILMFVLTWRKIKAVTLELSRVLDKDNSKRNLKNERNKEIFFRFSIFLRLFVIMGVSWIAEIISYFVANEWQAIFFVTDLLNAMQGLLIFLLFVFKKETKKLILKRFDQIRATPDVQWTKESRSLQSDKNDDKSGEELTKCTHDSNQK